MQTETVPADWRESLEAGDIVAFSFPSAESDPRLEKARPCLILEVDRDRAEALVAYGTAAWTRANKGLELHVTKPEDIKVAALRRPTRFVGARTTRVPLTSSRFVECAEGTAILGRLPSSFHARLERIRNCDIAAARSRFPMCRPRRKPSDLRTQACLSQSDKETA